MKGAIPLFVYVILLCTSCRTSEKLLLAGCGWNKVAIVDKGSGRIEWTHPLTAKEDCNDVELTAQGQILYAYRGGARLITRHHNVIWDYKVQRGEELYTATQETDGGFLLAICGRPSRIVHLDKEGQVVDELKFDTGIKNVHSQFRQIRRLDNGNYLIPLMGKGEVVEMNRKGEILKRVRCGGTPFSLIPLAEDRWLVSCGDGHNLVELDWKEERVVRQIDSRNLQDYTIHFAAEAALCKNGNVLFCNWNGHTKDKAQPLLIEVDRQGQVVWSLPSNPEVVNVSALFIFED